ncbi:hypothetical protein EET67_09870 [Pseudaminobacter arsenicus]|uniref:Uncharacterized protein n=1 Tax=Borborobacter arsenicus TaxID=1851146 RepID=A0A432V6V9_9HYPH|nr:hypothetical protein [Pseudaminobacter arsenicus]RUM97912.1 hypothetical protein EET67_09870 [Pseudaminobacter arsenicus]
MATGFEFFERDLKVATAGLEPEAISRELAKFAKEELAKAIAGGSSPQYERFVNGRLGAVEESVVAPGPILYVFSNWPLVINAALAELQKRAPRRSGRFASSFIVVVGGQIVSEFSAIPADAEVLITNFQPYVRKAEVGRLGIPKRRLFDGTKNVMARRFREAFRFETRFLNVGGGVHPMMPYILKGSGPIRLAAQNAKSAAFRAGRAVLAGRKDTAAGQPITYPAIVINMV